MESSFTVSTQSSDGTDMSDEITFFHETQDRAAVAAILEALNRSMVAQA